MVIDRHHEVSMPAVENILELQSVYEVLFQLQASSPNNTNHNKELLQDLLKSLLWARDKVITWNVRKSIKELDTTIAILSAKIKLIQYRLGECDGIELHQVCSLALVYFSNILEDSVVYNRNRDDGRKTLRDVSITAQLPVWLKHYRNRICHESTMGPCSSILCVLVEKSMKYMDRVYWSPVMQLKTFNAMECLNSINYIVNDNRGASDRKTHFSNLKLLLRLHQKETIQVLLGFLDRDNIKSIKRKNISTIFRLIFSSGRVDVLIDQLISRVEAKRNNKRTLNWLSKTIGAACLEMKENRKKAYVKLGMTRKDIESIRSVKNLSPLQCSRIAYRLVHLRIPIVRRLLMKMRRRLVRALGSERAQLLIQMTRMVLRDKSDIKQDNSLMEPMNELPTTNSEIEIINLE